MIVSDPATADIPSVKEMQAEVIGFLTSPPAVDGPGNVYSWINPAHPGFVYPEGMGLYLTLMSQLAASGNNPLLVERAHAVATRLQGLVPQSGGIGLRGLLYPFDTCMAVTGLLAYKTHLNGPVDPDILARMAEFIVDMARHRLTVVDEQGRRPEVAPHWSTVFGASMLKEVIALDAIARETRDESYRMLALEIAHEVIEGCFADGAFHVFPHHTAVYCHPHCYALEGLLHLRTRGYHDATALLRAGANRLSAWQNDDGSLYNWYQTPGRARQKVGDATAQAVRIWLAVDRYGYQPEIERGLGFLSWLRSSLGGLYYADGSDDINSITTIFAAQAMEWYLHGARPDCIA